MKYHALKIGCILSTEKVGWIFKKEKNIGWIPLGEQKNQSILEEGINISKWNACTLCNSKVCIGKTEDNRQFFHYCPQCLIVSKVFDTHLSPQ